MAAEKVMKGLDGVKADYTAVSTVGKHEAGLTYRGYAIEDLAEHCEFEEVAYLLIHKSLPSEPQLKEYTARLAGYRALSPPVTAALELLGKDAHPMDVLRTTASVLGCTEPEVGEAGKADTGATCERLMGAFVSAMCYWYHFSTTGTRIQPNTRKEDGLASSFLKMLRNDGKQPDLLHVRVINAAYILYAEHDLNASTFAARVIASTLSDTYSCIAGAIGALRGPLHGGANEAVMRLIQDLKSTEAAEALVREKISKKQLIMGFGHRIYKKGDPRNAVFKDLSRALSERPGGKPTLFEVSAHIEALMEKEKNMYPNADFFAASAYHQVGVPTDFFTPLFVVARTAGWCAHIQEQLVGNKIIRPSSAYNGPPKTEFVPMDRRSKL